MKAKILSLFLVLVVIASPLIFSGCGNNSSKVNYQLDLEVWGVFDDSDSFSEILQEYKKLNPQIREIRYKKIAADSTEYEKQLLDAIASQNGPDIFFVHNTWMTRHQNKIAPLPNSATKLTAFKENFVDVAYNDFVSNNQIYAMPLDCDTLALYYNKDLLNQAGITQPPATWNDVLQDIKQITRIDSFGNINPATISLGRANTPGGINRASDILMLFMLQAGAKMFDPNLKQVTFDQNQSGGINPGLSALNFYTHFALATDSQGNLNPDYTWNSRMDYNIDSFRYQKTAMILNYSYLAESLRKSDPKLNFDIAPVPQLNANSQVNFANFWGLAVAKDRALKAVDPNAKTPGYTQQDRINEAWKFVQYMTMKPASTDPKAFDPTVNYLNKVHKPAARRDLIEKQKTDLTFGVFANQALTAKSWPQPDTAAVEQIFLQMIEDVISGQTDSYEALRTAASRVNSLVPREF